MKEQAPLELAIKLFHQYYMGVEDNSALQKLELMVERLGSVFGSGIYTIHELVNDQFSVTKGFLTFVTVASINALSHFRERNFVRKRFNASENNS